MKKKWLARSLRFDLLARDLRIAIRGLRRSPTFAAATVLTLTIGIGMAVAIFTVFRVVLVERLPVVDQDRVVVLWTENNNGTEFTAGKHVLDAFRRETRTLHDVAGVVHWGATPYPLTDGSRTLLLQQAIVGGNFFDVLGARPALGRLLTRDDEIGGRFQPPSFSSAPHAMVLSYATWQREFGGDSAVIGRRVTDPYAQWTYTIVGVAPPGLDYPRGVSEWVPIGRDATPSVLAIGRLRPDVSPDAARAEYLAAMRRLEPRATFRGAVVHTLTDEVLGNARPAIVILTAAAGLLLLVACINVGNLLLLRATERGREIAIRRAIGASFGDVVRQLMVESLVLAVAGGLLGLGCAAALLRVLLALAPAELPRADAIGVSGAPVLAAIAVTTLALLAFGLAPALVAARADTTKGLRPDSRAGQESRGRRRARELLVVSQAALAVIMVSGAGLLGRSLARLQRLDLGLEASHLAFFAVALPASIDDTADRFFPLGDALFPRLRAVPGIAAATPVIIPPFIGANVWQRPFQAEGQSPSEARDNPAIAMEAGNADYFRTLGIPLLRGSGFSSVADPGGPLEAVVSESVARRLWPGVDPIGKRIQYDSTGWRTVVGVTPDLHFRTLRDATPTVVLRWRQNFWQGNVAVRTTRDFASVLPAIRRAVHDIEPRATVWQAQTMDDFLAGPLAQPRTSALLLAAFGVVALLLAAVGLYGVMAALVRQQTREIGVRIALGATPARLRRDVLARALGVVAIGAALGLVGALVTTRLYGALLFEVSPTDPGALVGACVLLIGVGLAAAYLPARRATRVDPALALRAE
jgi:predicted permease